MDGTIKKYIIVTSLGQEEIPEHKAHNLDEARAYVRFFYAYHGEVRLIERHFMQWTDTPHIVNTEY